MLENHRVSNGIITAFTNFIKTGNPSRGGKSGLPAWQPFSPTDITAGGDDLVMVVKHPLRDSRVERPGWARAFPTLWRVVEVYVGEKALWVVGCRELEGEEINEETEGVETKEGA